MKSTFLYSSCSAFLLLSIACSPKPKLDENRPVDLTIAMPEQKKKDYVTASTLTAKLGQSTSSTAKVNFQFYNGYIAKHSQNSNQSLEIARAFNSQTLRGKQFKLSILGNNITSIHEQSLINLLNQSGVDPLTFEVVAVKRTTPTVVVSKVFEEDAVKTAVLISHL